MGAVFVRPHIQVTQSLVDFCLGGYGTQRGTEHFLEFVSRPGLGQFMLGAAYFLDQAGSSSAAFPRHSLGSGC